MKNLDKEFMKLAKKNKLKRRLITIGISILTTVVILGSIGIWRTNYVKEQNKRASEGVNIFSEISSPNTFSTLTGFGQGLFNGSYTLSLYKNLNGIPVSVGTTSVEYGLSLKKDLMWTDFGLEDQLHVLDYGDSVKKISYNSDQKQAVFYQISLYDAKHDTVKEKFPQEIVKLEQVPDYVSEVAITFDKPYTYREILKMVPNNLLLNWLALSRSVDSTYYGDQYIDIGISTTVDTYSKGEIDYDESGKKIDINYRESISTGVYGSYDGVINSEMYSDFISAVKRSVDFYPYNDIKLELSNGEDFYPYRDAVKQVKKHPKLDDATFSGIILSGRNENFKQLQDKSWISASSIGATTRYFPYLPTTK